MAKTYRDRLAEALNNFTKADVGSLDRLLAYAYYAGREQATRAYADKVREVLKEQQERARSLRYYKLGMYVQGNIDYVYSSDYAGDYQAEFGNDLTDL